MQQPQRSSANYDVLAGRANNNRKNSNAATGPVWRRLLQMGPGRIDIDFGTIAH